MKTLSFALLGAALALPADAQTLAGRVVDAGSAQAVPQVQVTATNEDGRAAGRVLTDTEGRFTLPLRNAGTYRLSAERAGYQATLTQAVDVGPRDTVEVEVRLSSEALRVEPLTVTARRQPQRRVALDGVGFYSREAIGLGRFLHREDLERQHNQNVVQILDRLPGTIKVRVGRGTNAEAIVFQRSSNAGAIIRAQRGQAAHCLPKVYLDGTPMFYDEGGLNSMVEPESLEAVEVYGSTSQVPAQYNADASCGVILMWSRKEP
jgi:hypothetical protein